MRLLPIFLAVVSVSVSVCTAARHGVSSSSHRRVVRAVALPDGQTVYAVASARSLRPSKVDRVDREQRVLKKKKRRLKALREEIRALSGQLRPPHPDKANKTKDARWRKKVLEKMKVIVRRLERMERTMEGKMTGGGGGGGGGGPVILRERKSGKRAGRPQPIVLTTLAPVSATVARPAVAHATMTPDKVKSLHSSVLRSMSGENGTACVTHGDCRPGRCCHRFTQAGAALQQCRFHGLEEGQPCRDSCQCANRLHCFQSTGNTTESYCKSALVEDIRQGSYLYDKESHFTDPAPTKTKKKKRAAKTATKSGKPTKRQ